MSLDFAAIDRFLGNLEKAKDDDELRQLFDTYNAAYDLNVPEDPFSEAYRVRQFTLYEKLYGKPYSTSHEQSPFDVSAAAINPFPYVHGSWSTVGNQLIAIGFIIKAMALPKGAKILEFGPGWGNTTLALAKMGYEVTAIDIEENFVELIRERARMEGISSLNVAVGDFSEVENLTGPFDAVLFFECFHHCSDHLRMMRSLDRVIKPKGIVCFGAEPIAPDFPIPWGLRMDGQSIWAIRKNGWLELGFNLSYFEEAMYKNGWWLTRLVGQDSPWASALIARRLSEIEKSWNFLDGLKTEVGVGRGAKVQTDSRAGYLMFGPYTSLPNGSYSVKAHVDKNQPSSGRLVFDVARDFGRSILASQEFYLPENFDGLRLNFTIGSGIVDLEFRLRCDARTQVTIEGTSVERCLPHVPSVSM